MANVINSLGVLLSQAVFSLVTPPLLIPRFARMSFTRRLVAFCFGRLYGDRYQYIIDAFEGTYGLAMEAGLARAKEITGLHISLVVDCGTGTGFATQQAARHFPDAVIVGVDILHGMLVQARGACTGLEPTVVQVQADNFALPLRDNTVDLLLVQNTIPCFEEFARVCRPSASILYVDTSAGWIAGLARRLTRRNHYFERVISERVGLGFYILGQKEGVDVDGRRRSRNANGIPGTVESTDVRSVQPVGGDDNGDTRHDT